MEYVVAGIFVSSIVGVFLGSLVAKGSAGFFLGLFLGPIGWIIVFLLPRETNVDLPVVRDLSNETYKVWLGNAYKVKRNELFDKYECGGKTFDSLDEVLIYADSLEREKRKADDQGRGFLMVVLAVGALVTLILISAHFFV